MVTVEPIEETVEDSEAEQQEMCLNNSNKKVILSHPIWYLFNLVRTYIIMLWMDYIFTHGHTWTYIDIHGHTWTYMDIHGHTWTYMDIH